MHSKHYCRSSFYGDKLSKTKKAWEKIVRNADHAYQVEYKNIMNAMDKKEEMYEKAYQVVLIALFCEVLTCVFFKGRP